MFHLKLWQRPWLSGFLPFSLSCTPFAYNAAGATEDVHGSWTKKIQSKTSTPFVPVSKVSKAPTADNQLLILNRYGIKMLQNRTIEFLMNISGCYSRLGWSISPCLCEHECQSCRLRLRQNLQNVSWIGQKILRDPDVSSSDDYSSGRGKSGTQTATLLKKEMYHHHNHSTLFLVVPCHYKILLLLNACCAEKHW